MSVSLDLAGSGCYHFGKNPPVPAFRVQVLYIRKIPFCLRATQVYLVLSRQPEPPRAIQVVSRLLSRAVRAIWVVSDCFDCSRKTFRWFLGCFPEQSKQPESWRAIQELPGQKRDMGRGRRIQRGQEELGPQLEGWSSSMSWDGPLLLGKLFTILLQDVYMQSGMFVTPSLCPGLDIA